MKNIDLHIHTTSSDGTFTPKELVDYALKKDLAAIAITDHDTMDGIQEATNYIRKHELTLELIPGMEMSTNYHHLTYSIHILAYFPDALDVKLRNIVKSVKNTINVNPITTQEAINFIAQHGGISVLAHPKEYCLSMNKLEELINELALIGIKGIECIYPTHSKNETKQLSDMATRHNLLITGGTDFHGSRKPGIDLGSGFGDLTIPYDIIPTIKSN